ncbi:MAG: YceI family protein [Actinobacteria bacterium]|nr:YceI family protein [Actinomycetota bacterium]
MLKIFFAIGLFAFLFASSVPASETYVLDTQNSKLEWKAKKVTGQHFGTVAIKDGSVTINGNDVESGSFQIDMTTITDLDLKKEMMRNKLIKHLKSDDFFAVEKYPVTVFKITKVIPLKSGNTTYRVTGNLTIKGITHEIQFPAVLSKIEKGYKLNAAFAIDRTKWGLRYNSGKFFQKLGDRLIYDDIHFKLSVVVKKSAMK